MNTTPFCDKNHQYGFLFNAVIIPITLIIQSMLLIHAIYHHHAAYRQNKPQSLKHSLFYIIMVLLGLYFLFNELFRLVIDPYWPSIQHTIFCDITAYTPRFLPYLFYLLYIFQILFRIEAAFRDSYLAISKDVIHIITIVLCLEGLLSPLCLLMDGNVTSCLATWEYSNDTTSTNISSSNDTGSHFCTLQLSAFSNIYLVFVGVAIVLIHNVALTVLFAYKLRRVVSHTSDSNIGIEFRALIFKNTILVVFGLTSTIVSYSIFAVTRQSAFVFMDVVINSVVIGLMFQYNEGKYKWICRPCIAVCLVDWKSHKRVGSLSTKGSPSTELHIVRVPDS